ncbi:MAG: alpha/beta hydrolase, partial [Nitrososphaerota archaeon]|nr:alpha/beta hydrolase [Nitrososphaerota archaeon]
MLDFATYASPHDAVFVHGAGGNSLLWRRTLQNLSGERRALAVNLPGHPAGDITCRSVKDYAESLRDFLEEAGLDSPAVCGHSMGGAVALSLSIEHPDELGGLILASTGAKLGVDPQILEGLKARPMKTIEGVITPWSFASIDLGLGREARAALSVSNLPVFLNDYEACKGFDVRQDLPKISARTLVVCGDKDRMTPPKWSHFLAAQILESELRFIKDSGHMLPLEKPESLARVVQGFLEGLG